MYVIILTECVAILYTPLPLQGEGLGVGSNLIPPSVKGYIKGDRLSTDAIIPQP
jgi:hypothetical protein